MSDDDDDEGRRRRMIIRTAVAIGAGAMLMGYCIWRAVVG